MSLLNFIRGFGSVLNLSPAPSHLAPTVEGAIDDVMSRFEQAFSQPEDQPVFTSDERRIFEMVGEPTNSEPHAGATPFDIGESIYINGPGVRYILDPMKDLEPQIRAVIGALQIANPMLKFQTTGAAEARTGERSALTHPTEGGGEAKA
jgi:hypothetical protein